MSDWPHSPVHRVHEVGTYMVTAGTYLKRPLFRGPERLRYLCGMLLELAEKYKWQLQAWAGCFPTITTLWVCRRSLFQGSASKLAESKSGSKLPHSKMHSKIRHLQNSPSTFTRSRPFR